MKSIMKTNKILCIALLLLSTIVQAQNLKIVVNEKGKVGFKDDKDNWISYYEYDGATPFTDGVSIVSKSGKSGIIDEKGNVLLPLKYNSITKWTDNIYLLKDGKKMGLSNKRGEILLDVVCSSISRPNCYGKAIFSIGGNPQPVDQDTYFFGARYGIVDSNGHICVNAIYGGLYEFSYEGKNYIGYNEGKRLEFSYHCTKDTLKTDCKMLGYNNNGWAIAKAGILDESGNIILKMGLYDQIMLPKNNMVRFYMLKKKETICGYHNLETNMKYEAAKFRLPVANINFWTHGDFTGDIAPVNGDTWSFIDKSGNVLRKGFRQLRHSESLGLWAAETQSGTWEVFDEKNNTINSLTGFNDFLFPTYKDDKELFSVKKDDKYGVITKEGTTVAPFVHEFITGNNHNVFMVKENEKWGAMNTEGQTMIPTEYISVTYPTEYDAQNIWVKKADSLYYNYNIPNQRILTCGYKNITNFKDGIALVSLPTQKIEDTAVNRAMMYAPNTAQATINQVNVSDHNNSYGILIKEDGTVLFNQPITTLYAPQVREKIKQNNYKPLGEREVHDLLLQLTNNNRSYNLKSTLSEDEWNY